MYEPKRVTFFRLIDVIAVFLNVSSVTDVLLAHVLKTVSGNLTSLRFVQYAKAPVPIELNPVNLSSSLNVCINVFDLNLVWSGKVYKKSIQCSANPLQNKFNSNTLISKFPELNFFTKVTALNTTTIFGDCTNLESLGTYNITSLSQNINSRGQFGNTKIANVYLPNLTFLGAYAFYSRNGNPEIIVFGKDLATIRKYGFYGINKNASFFIYATTPPIGDTSDKLYNAACSIYVPDDAYDAYISSSHFADIKGRIKKLSEYTGEKPWEKLYPEELGLVSPNPAHS